MSKIYVVYGIEPTGNLIVPKIFSAKEAAEKYRYDYFMPYVRDAYMEEVMHVYTRCKEYPPDDVIVKWAEETWNADLPRYFYDGRGYGYGPIEMQISEQDTAEIDAAKPSDM